MTPTDQWPLDKLGRRIVWKRAFRSDYSKHWSPECESAVCIPLTKGRHTLIDAEDYPKIVGSLWCEDSGYATNRKVGFIHCVIADTPPGFQTDHINRDTLDNRKQNLRVCTQEQNQWNSRKMAGCRTPYKGVSIVTNGKYQASISVGGRLVYLGVFITAEEAAIAYDTVAKQVRGEYARVNF